MSEEKKELIKKQYYDVVIEITSPITIKYRVFAEDAKQAAELVEKGWVSSPSFVSKPKIQLSRIHNLTVYLAGSVMKLFSWKR